MELLIDADPGVDDVMSILMALADPNVNVRAITVTYGNTNLNDSIRNLCSIFHTLDLQKRASGMENYQHNNLPRVAIGAAKPLKGPLYIAGYYHGKDGLGNLSYTHPELVALVSTSDRFISSPFDAVDEILYQLKSLPPFALTIVALGPLTNLALAIQKDPVTMSRVKQIVVMGGALLVPGNMSPLAEFNFYADPYAVNVVFNQTRGFNGSQYLALPLDKLGLPQVTQPLPLHVSLIPVNLTHTTLMSKKVMDAYLSPIQLQPIVTFYTTMLSIPFKRSEKIHGLALHDPVAMGVALGFLQPHRKRFSIEVEEESGITRGLCVIDLRPKAKPQPDPSDINVEVCYATENPSRFQFLMLKRSFFK
ncbi:hypothetical protein L0F63_002755 [Massospora cicadina]|nr:hypothetical protein L0F63_002755 [Massospora cicadina]